jgi:hypothetical protein
VISRNALIRPESIPDLFACAATVAKRQSKFLNHRVDSCVRIAVTNAVTPPKIFNIFFTIAGREH